MAPAAAAMGGGADTGSGLVGLAKKFALTGTSSMMAEVRVQRRKRRDLCLCLLFKSLKLHSRQRSRRGRAQP